MLKLLCVFPCIIAASNQFGDKFLADNKVKDGVITLPSGLQYKVLRAGTGAYHPTIDSPCRCHYEGRTAENYPSGKKFASYERGETITFAPQQGIKGWTEAMQLMVEGDKWEMYLPSGLAYGDRGYPPSIPGGAVLVWTMEIITITGRKIPATKTNPIVHVAQAQPETLLGKEEKHSKASNASGASPAQTTPAGGVQDLGDGLKLLVKQPGDGKTFPHAGDELTMHYTLTLAGDSSGKVIDSSRSRNEPFTFTIGRGEVSRGWDMVVIKMSLGQRGILTVPAALGYGERGVDDIPPNSDLSFDVELLGIGDAKTFPFLAPSIVLMAVGFLALVVFCSHRYCRTFDTDGPKGFVRELEMSIERRWAALE